MFAVKEAIQREVDEDADEAGRPVDAPDDRRDSGYADEEENLGSSDDYITKHHKRRQGIRPLISMKDVRSSEVGEGNVCKLVEELRKQYPELPVAKRSRRQASICSTLNAIESERLNSINPERKSTFETIDSLELAKDYINTKLVSQVTTTDHGRPRASTVTSAHASTPALFRRLSVNTPYIPETTRERAKSTEADTDQLILSINQLKTFT
ncbi:Oidioi.mRNA.OKI2018_I69.XSR.g16660.t1.cds [Oikopleura dioica]|uniref:Oidioi.mRNA.OKI2018_I69.XSR.g16660.t1.cds n=1 Tax=Oikopleura dioica TaxID=34765 RepID=A0ABN7SKV8_OIKDI|nr:Oidioi.mRNA.OKI2018_I69.XSR.g16660.t1.cds [Oikopleura dioica]